MKLDNRIQGDDIGSNASSSYWKIQPTWAKWIIILFGVPAWIILGFCIFMGRLDQTVITACVSVIVGVAALQAVFVARAYWNHEI